MSFCHRPKSGLFFFLVLWISFLGSQAASAVFVEDINPPDPAIFADDQAHPQIVTLRTSFTSFCTGTIVASDRVLIAAHCLFPGGSGVPVPAQNIEVFVDHNANATLKNQLWSLIAGQPQPGNDPPLVWPVDSFVVHPDFNTQSFTPSTDVAILNMATPIPPSLIAPLPVVPQNLLPAPFLPDMQGLDRWTGYVAAFSGGGATNDDCETFSTGQPSPIQRLEAEIYDVEPTFGGYSRFRSSGGTGLSTSHLCPGDSGGPVLTTVADYVGINNVSPGQILSLISHSQGNHELGPVLQAPGVRNFLVANALDYDQDGIEAAFDTCDSVSNPSQSTSDADGDGFTNECEEDDDADGILDGEDNCPLVANPDQMDSDSDGKGDACDPDDDNDGVADSVDNCLIVPNPDQLNCNADAELASAWGTDGIVLGDACDRAPCADPSLDQDQFVTHTVVGPYVIGDYLCTDLLGREIRSTLDLREVMGTEFPALASNDLELRFCYCPFADPVQCAQAPYYCRLDPLEVNLPEATSAQSPSATTTRWLRIDLDSIDQPPVDIAQPLAALYQPHPAPSTYYRWDYEQDADQWVTMDQIFTPTPADPNIYGPGTDLTGILWAHDPSSVGWQWHFDGFGCPLTGSTDCAVADSFEFDAAPDRATTVTYCKEIPQTAPAPWWTYCPQCFDAFQNPYDEVTLPVPFVSLLAESKQALMWLPESERPEGWPMGGARNISSFVSRELVTSLTEGRDQWVGASEPLSVAGREGLPRALAVSVEGTDVVASLAVDASGFDVEYLSQAAAVGGQKASMEAREGFATAYSLDEETLFVLGGVTARGEVASSWMYRPGGSIEPLDIDPRNAPRQAESAVYSTDDRKVWVIDKYEGSRWLRRIDPRTGRVDTELLRAFDEAEQLWLTALEDGRVVVVVAHRGTWTMHGLSWSAGGELLFEGIVRGEGTIVSAPGVRAGKISLALEERGRDTIGVQPIAVDAEPLFRR